jgi:uncharacterized protein (DUF433 family)
MTTRKSEKGGPREPHNVPIRVWKSKEEESNYKALYRDIRSIVKDGIRRGVLPSAARRKKARRPTQRAVATDWRAYIEVRFDREGGRPFFKGTRVAVEDVLSVFGAGESIAKIFSDYHITPKAVLAAVAFAAELLAREDVIEILGDEDLHRRS